MFKLKLFSLVLLSSIAYTSSQDCSNFDVNQPYNIREMVRLAELGGSVYTKATHTGPYGAPITYTYETVGGVQILRTMSATLRKNTIPEKNFKRPGHPRGIDNRMRDLNKQPNDEKGHLLALSLGGANELFNYVPQDQTVNSGKGTTEHNYSFWKSTEENIRKLLLDGDRVQFSWKAVVFYPEDLTVPANRRPCGFGMHYSQNVGDITFSNV